MNRKALILLAPLLAFFGAWLLLRTPSRMMPTQNPPIMPDPSQTPDMTLTTETIDTTTWKTYRNEEYGFELKYPEEWVMNQEGDRVFFGSKDTEKIVPLLEMAFENGNVDQWIYNFNRNQSSTHTQILFQEKYNVGNTTGTKVVHSTDIGLNENVVLIQVSEKNMIVFSYPLTENISFYENIVQAFRLN